VHEFARFYIYCDRLRRALCLPSPDRFANNLVDGLGESMTCLVDRDIQIANGSLSRF
jgi:hypothetical protein